MPQRPVGPFQPKLAEQAEQAVAADGQSPANNESMDVKVNS